MSPTGRSPMPAVATRPGTPSRRRWEASRGARPSCTPRGWAPSRRRCRSSPLAAPSWRPTRRTTAPLTCSGPSRRPAGLEELNKGQKPSPKYTVSVEPINDPNIRSMQNGNSAGKCSENKAAHAAHPNKSPITGMDTRWRGQEGDNKYNEGVINANDEGREDKNIPVDPKQMRPCNTCAHSSNIEIYMNHANANTQ